MHFQIEIEGKRKPALTSGIPELAYIDLPEIKNKTVWNACQTTKKSCTESDVKI